MLVVGGIIYSLLTVSSLFTISMHAAPVFELQASLSQHSVNIEAILTLSLIADVGSTEESVRNLEVGPVLDVKMLEDVPLLGRYPMTAHVKGLRGCFPSFPGYIAGKKTTAHRPPYDSASIDLSPYRFRQTCFWWFTE
ncbi:hypothetical protein ARMGADRAFT_683547 [Armillaria gallica]|uniref:Uncharacterized protein n=1 Tax=Armillaria gallica TaxID=47427 RepID=A0A2H3CIY2_ARMGA|nr:hypothetical protein ARMGADRAFT_683547 [Armillaria gallica]